MSENTIVVIKARAGDVDAPVLVLIAMAGPINPDAARAMGDHLREFRDTHPDTPPILILGAQHGGWTAMQTDDPEAARLAGELQAILA